MPLHEVLDPEGRDIIEDPQASMMLSEDEWGLICEHGNNFQPYMDEILQTDDIKYQQFVHDLYEKGMIEFTDTPQDMVTPFFVKKKQLFTISGFFGHGKPSLVLAQASFTFSVLFHVMAGSSGLQRQLEHAGFLGLCVVS